MPVVLLLAALVVVATSIWIVIDGVRRGAPDTLRNAPPVTITIESPEAHAVQGETLANPSDDAADPAYMIGSKTAMPLGPESERPAAETGFSGHLRD
jgi:hypothetical protein